MRLFIQGIFLYFLLSMVPGKHAWSQSGTGKVISRNDHIFPAAPQAKPFIDYDSKGFLIKGKRTFIVSAGMEYARVPRALWRDRLLKFKRGGFNAVEVYTFWNYHEPREGEFDFSGDQDLNAFLKLVRELNMYSIVRVGPYYCGEWTLGGFPIWLKFKPGLRVREDNPQFLAAVDNFFNKLIPIVANNQINHGGSVIMVQLENEHKASWGNIVPNDYFRYLINKTVSLGLQVPYFFSGLHPGNDPAGNKKSLDDPLRPNPWFSTEYWSVWFSNYGPQPQDSTIYDRRTWKIIAHGGNGYNVYMAHGGTNFEYNNDRDMAASYDYGAAVGQAGDLRPVYYSFKRAAWFARSFEDILADSRDATDKEEKSSATDPAVTVSARYSPAGTVTFLDNPGSESVETKIKAPENTHLPLSGQIRLAAGEIMPVVHNFTLIKDVKLAWAPTRIYNIISQGNTTTLLVYGAAGSPAQVYFNIPPATTIIQGKQNLHLLSPGILQFSARFSSSAPEEYAFETGGHRIRIIAVNDILVQRTWFVETGSQNNIVIGPAFAGEATFKGNRLNLVTERSWQDSTDFPVWIYKPAGRPVQLIKKNRSLKHITDLKLRAWQMKNASGPVMPGYDDKNWKLSNEPLQMGADGDVSANAWYRTKVIVPETGKYTLQFKNVRERASLFLDGRRIDTGGVFHRSIDMDLKAGRTYNLTVFTAHNGRNKQLFYVGPLDSVDAKGLTGPVTLKKSDGSGTVIPVNQWRMKGGPGNPDVSAGWKSIPNGSQESHPAFFRTNFTVPPLPGTRHVWRVITNSLSYGSVWVNGHNLGRYPEKIKIDGLYIPENCLKNGNNTLVIYDENGTHPEQVAIRAERKAGRDVTIYIENDRLK